jgi:NAD(P)-dependent dehydrogenase (short-subunit alcohol dehydrogenase family)
MTDIQRQFKVIHKSIQNYLKQNMSMADFRENLRQVLPDSYGIASGYIQGENGKRSEYCNVLIYDKPLAAQRYNETSQNFQIQHVLLVLELTKEAQPQSLQELLARIASVKKLVQRKKRKPAKKLPPMAERREKIPTDRLPVVILACENIVFPDTDLSSMALFLRDIMQAHPFEEQPDYLYAFANNLAYRNPLLDEQVQLSGFDIGVYALPELQKPRVCYICKEHYRRAHFFYRKLCVACGDMNYLKRIEMADLRGYTALVTGGRLKIGYALALRFLRLGAEVIVSSRFPHDTAQRYAQETDFHIWRDRLHIYGMDMRDIHSVLAFIEYLKSNFEAIDILINNAAQTVRRPPVFYKHLMAFEEMPAEQLPTDLKSLLIAPDMKLLASAQNQALLSLSQGNSSAHLSQIPMIAGDEIEDERLFPPNQYDADGQQVDNRQQNSWTSLLNEVAIPELLEVYVINAIAPSLLVGQLREMMKCSPKAKRFIVNVTAVEGQFTPMKTGIHPHTSMAKAALNMLSYSIASDYQSDGIYVTSVDPGWVSDQVPHESDEERVRNQALLPIDLEDAAARICDPIFQAINHEKLLFGVLLKDYLPAQW